MIQINDLENFVNLFPNIERLDLSENRFEYLNIPLISAFKKLKILILSKNKIRHLNLYPATITPNPSNSLIELDLSYNGSYPKPKHRVIRHAFSSVVGIETIDENIFESISSQLEILNLRNNELSNENQLGFLIHLNHLREFYLDYNRFESINQLNFPLNLKILSLKNNRLNQLDLSLLTRLEYLEKLFLSSNKLTKLSLKIKHSFASLEILELDRNHLAFIQSLNAPKLKQLNLDGNYLGRKIEKKIFSNLSSLERLHLRDNQIEVIDPNAFQNTRLQSLGNSLHFFGIFIPPFSLFRFTK
jgi:Leucine-rich repeat (LRR) protein